jgi:hypothetical protein
MQLTASRILLAGFVDDPGKPVLLFRIHPRQVNFSFVTLFRVRLMLHKQDAYHHTSDFGRNANPAFDACQASGYPTA